MPRSEEKEEELLTPVQRAPCNPRKTMVDAWSRLWPCGKPVLELAPGRTCGSMQRGACTEVGLLVGCVTPWGNQHWTSLFLKDCSPGRKTMLKQVKIVSPPPPKEEVAAENIWRTDHNSHSPFPYATGWEEVRENQEWRWAYEEGCRNPRVFHYIFYSLSRGGMEWQSGFSGHLAASQGQLIMLGVIMSNKFRRITWYKEVLTRSALE